MGATIRTMRAAIEKGEFASTYCFHGDDDFRKDVLVRELVDGAVELATRDFNLDVVRGSEISSEHLGSLLQTPPMMAPRRVVVIRDALSIRKDARSVVERYLEHPPPDTVLILVVSAGGKPDGPIRDGSTIIEVGDLHSSEVSAWIEEQVRSLGGAGISPAARESLQSTMGADSGQLFNELDKLVSYSARAVIDEDAVQAVVGFREKKSLSDFLDRVAARDVPGALALVDVVLAQPKTTLVSVVMALTVQTLALSWGRGARDSGVPAHRIGGEYYTLLKESSAYPMRPWGEAVKCWSRSLGEWDSRDLRRATLALRAADRSAKDTRLSGDEQLLANLVCTMCTRDLSRAA